MLTKQKIIHSLLAESWVSGVDVATRLGLSRTAVWNHIVSLREKGYAIKSDPKRGYKLQGVPSSLYPELVSYGLGVKRIGRQMIHHDLIGSTNTEAMRIALDLSDGTVVVAEQQDHGRGRLNRKWESVSGKSILFSVVLKPDFVRPVEAYKFTMFVAVSLSEVLIESTGIDVDIKWPNDIYVKDKKVAGILTEMSAEADTIKHVVVGIGINMDQSSNDFSGDLKNAGSLSMFVQSIDRLVIFRQVLSKLDFYYDKFLNGNFDTIFSKWKHMCTTKGKTVRFKLKNVPVVGVVDDILEDGALSVKVGGGDLVKLYSGDITIL